MRIKRSLMPRFFTETKCEIKNTEIRKIILHNIQSLRQHFKDMAQDNRIMDTDVICLTETWLSNVDTIDNFHLTNFHFFQQTRHEAYEETDDMYSMLKKSKGGGVAVYVKDTCSITRKLLPVKNIEGVL